MQINFHTHSPRPDEHYIQSLGLHPWHLDAATLEDDLRRLRKQLTLNNYQMIGECGLDTVCTTPFSLQLRAFTEQLSISETMQMPVIVHCVRSFGKLLQLRKQQTWSQHWVVHGFVGSPQLAQQLALAGIHVSFGAALLDERRIKVMESLRSLWQRQHYFFLETDERPHSIREIYQQAATLLRLPLPPLETFIETSLASILNPCRSNNIPHATTSTST